MTGTRGYFISQMNAVWVSASSLKQEELQSKSKQSFYNYNLGMPYEDTKVKVVPEDIDSNARFPHPKMDREDYALIAVGIDWGNQHSIIVKGMKDNGMIDVLRIKQINNYGVTDAHAVGSDIQAIRAFLMPYEPDIIVADIGDAGDRVSALIDIYGANKVFGCKFTSDPTSGLRTATNQIEPQWNENSHIVTVDKLMQVKRYISMMKDGRFGFYAEQDQMMLVLKKHWDNVVIRDEELPSGDFKQVITRKGTDNTNGDHTAIASVYALIGLDYLRKKYGNGDSTFAFDVLSTNLTNGPEKTDLQNAFDTKDINQAYF